MGVPTTGPWKWTFFALLLVSAPILKADPTQSECTSDEECLSRNLERAKRSSDPQVEVNGDQTTTYYLKTDSVGRPRPLGLITSTEGAFVNDGTTTQYTTQILGMSLHGTYAKIISTSQRVFSPIPIKTNVPEYHPTGMVSSVVDTTVIDGTTTLQTTELYRTFIGNLYAQEIVSRSEVIKPTSIVAEAEIHATATVQSSIVTEIPSEHSTSGSIVFQKSYLTQIVGQRLTPSISIQREEDWATEDSNKLLDSFTEDNLLRARKADTEGAIIVDHIQPNKPAIALATFRAGRRLDEIFADEDAQKSTTSSPPSTTTTEKQQEVVVRTEQRIESHEVKGDSVVVKVVHQDVPVIPSPALLPTAVPEDPTKPTTVTYEGFAAFTTQVGNTHIVFKPSTGLSPSSALPRPSVESSTVVLDTSEPIVSSHVTMDLVASVEVSSQAPVVVITSQVSSSESMVGKEEKELVTTPEPAILQEAEAPLRMNALMSNKPLEVMATALEESHESARKARISVGDNPWVVFATNSVVEVEAPTARQIGTDSSTLVTDVKPAQESVKESLAESSTPTPVLVSETSTPTPVIAMATEQAETPVKLSPMKSESISVFSAVTEENIPAPEVENTKEEVVLTMSSEEPETETEAATEPNPMPAVIMPSMIEPEEMTMSGTAFITYTYFTTFFDDRTTKVITREEVVANVLKTGSSDDAAFTADPGHQARGIFSSVDSGMMKTFFTTYTYFTTLSVDDQTVVSSRTEVYSNVLMASGQAMDDSVMAEFGLVAENESLPVERSSSSTTSTTVLPSTVRQLETSVWAGKVMEPHTESDESMNHPVAQAAPALLAVPNSLPLESSMTQVEPVVKTLFTTFTYFTTFFNEGTSTVTSKEETVTNVLTEGGETTALTATEAIFPVTYYTTFTYWTTSTNDGQVVVTSREETQSRVVIPTETEASGAVPTGTTEEPAMSSTVVPNLTTFYTTFTYFTTSFDGETPVVSSSFETVTNVVNSLSAAVEQSSARAVGEVAPSNAIQEPIGFLSSLTTVEVNNGITTSFSTDVVGTFINGLYATILESTSSVVAVESSPRVVLPQTTSRFPVGLVSVNVGTAYDIDDPTTTYFTSKAFGTYIGDLYAQVIESTTSLGIDEAKSVTVALDEFRTGLVRSIEGSIVKDSLTTVYASQIVGTIIDGLYAQVIQSTSTFIEATPVAVIAEASTAAAPGPEAPVIDNSALPQPATTPLTLEGSISAEVTTPSAEENDATPTGESKLLGGKLKFPSRPSPASRSRPAFSPSFRPVNTQRPRPGLPIKKAKPSSSSASIEPSPVSASSFSATRVASSRFTSSSVRSSATATPSSNRLFRLTRPSSSGFAASSASSFGSTLSPRRSSSFVNPSAAGSSNFRRSSSSSEALGQSRVRSSSGLPLASSRSSSGVAGLTRLHQRGSSSAAPKIQPTPVVEENVASVETPVEETLHEDLQDIAEEPQEEVTAPPKQPGRLPLRPVTPRPAPSTTANSRRQFPFRRPQLPTTSAPASTAESDNGIIGGPTTSKPRFVRPPRITVTARPRPTLSPLSSRFVKRPGQFDDAQEDIDTQSSNLSPLRRRSKREDPFFTRQQRGTVRRRQVFEQGRRASPSRSTPTRTRAASWEEPAAVDYLDYDASEEAPATSKTRFSSSSRQTTSSFRNRAAATTQAPPARSRPSRPRLSPTGARQSEFTLTNRQPTSSQRFRKPETTNTRSSFRRPETTTSSRTRTRVNSQTVTTEEPRSSTGRRFNSNSRRPSSSSTRVRDNEFEEVPPTRQREAADAAPALVTPLTVTHRVPSETTIPIVKNGATEYRTVITAMPSLQVLPTYSSTKIAGSWRYLASELSSIKGPGVTEVTQYFIKPSETNIVEFTPTTIRGRHTSFSHLIPSTVYEVETSVTSIQDPVAATNNLLQQLLLGNLGANPLLGVPGAPATPVTQFTTHTSTYVTTLTDALSTILPITLRGKEVRTTIVHSTTSVVTLTEMSTETNIITPAVQQLPFAPQANPLASLLPVLLQNQLLQGQLGLQPTPALQAQPIQPTIAPQTHEEEKIIDSPRKSTRQQQKFEPEEEEDHHDEIIQPAKPQPVTSVVTLYLSGRRPGEFSSVLSTVTLDGSEASVVKRHSPQTASPIEASALPFAIGTDKGLFELPDGYTEEDLEYYLVSAMNEIGAEEIYDTAEAQHLQYVLTHAQPTPELNGDYGKKLQGKNRKARQAVDSNEDDSELLSSLVEDDWARVVPASQPQPLVKQVHELPEPAAPSKVRKTKTVIVTRKVRPTAGVPEITPSEVLLEELGITNTLRRKVVVVSRRVKNSKSAVDPLIEPTFAFQEVSGNDLTSAVVQESASFEPVSAPSSVTPSATREGRRLVTVTRKRPVSASDLPDLQASTSTPAQEAPATTPKSAPQLDGSLGDVYAPRTYYTIYSYLYTVLNTGVDKPVSSRLVTVSEIVRGKDGRLPSTFFRTENNNGLYTLATGNGNSDLGTRVSQGETLHVNLASAILVKYGRGAIRAHPSADLKPLDSSSATQKSSRVRPTPVEPSFTSPVEENNRDSSPVATQSLPSRIRTTITRTIARTQARPSATTTAKQSEKASTSTTRATSPQRQRGTVRFGGSSGSITRSVAVPQVAATTSRTFVRRPTFSSSRTIVTPVSQFTQPSKGVSNSLEDDYQEPEFDHDYQDNPEHFDEYHEYDEDLPHDEGREDSVEDVPQYDEEYPEHEDDYIVDDERINESEEPIHDDASLGISPASSSTRTVASSIIVSSSRSRVNPLEKHLSSIRAAARSSSGVTSSSILPFRSRLAQRLSASSSLSGPIEPSHVYYHTFATTSTLLVDGGRDPVLVTLMTSTLTTIADSQLSIVTESPQAFSPVTSTSSSPLLRSSSRLSLFSTRVASSRNSPASSATSTVVPTLSTLTTVLTPSTEAVEASFVTTEVSLEESTEPITTPMPESVETTPLSVEGEEEMKQEAEAVVPARANPATTTVISTVLETELRTFTAVVTRKSNDEEIVTTHFETVPEVITKTITVVQTLDAPTARFVGNAGASAQIIDPSPKAGLRGGRLSIDANARLPLATKVMSNGVEVIVAGERKNTLLAHEVVQGTQVLDASSPFTLPPTAISNAMLVDSEVLNQGLLSSIQSATAEFITQTYLTTFTYLTTLLEDDLPVVSSRHEIISNVVTREPGHFLTTPVPDLTLTSGFVSPSYSTYTYLTTYTYYNTFLDSSRPVVLKSKETVSNIVTIPADSANKMIQSSALFDTQTYLRTYTFFKTLSDSVHTTEEVITQVVVTEAPIQTQVPVQPTPTVSSELTKTYLTTVTYLTTEVEGTDTVIRQDTVVSSEVVTETIFSEVEATPTLPLPVVSAQPNLEASLPLLPVAEDSDGPIFATKTYFTTSTYYTTMLEDESTVVKSRTEITSSVATERLPQGLGALLMSTDSVFVPPSDSRTTYLSFGDNVYGQLRTILATATYYITDAQGSVATKQLVIPQISTSTITTSALPSDAVIQPSSSILSSGSLASVKASFLASSSASPSSILSADQLQSIKSSFLLSSTPTFGPEEADSADITTSELSTDDGNTLPAEPTVGGAVLAATPELNLPFPPPQVGTAVVTSPTTVTGLDGSVSSVSSGATVVMVTDAAGGVAVLPTEVLTSGATVVGTIVNQKPSLWNLGTLGTVGLAALSQGLAGNTLGGLNINLGPVIDSMTGLISSAFLTRRNDSIARTQSRVPAEIPVQQQDPIFIPVGSIGASQNDREDVVARQPTFIPLRRLEPGPQQPAPAVPLQPRPGSPLFRPGTDPRPLVHFPGQPADGARPGGFRSPGIETGFSAIQPTTRATVITGAETVFLGRPNLALDRPNGVNFEQHQQGPINPSRPIISHGATTHFFDPNGQPFPDRSPVRFPSPLTPPNQPILGNLVPGPDGKPVRIVAVPEGINPPPGASGQVFVRPAAPAVQPGLEPAPAIRPVQQTPALPTVRPGSAPIRPLPIVEFDQPRPVSPSVQTIVSIEGDNKIVGTRIVSQGQTVLIQPTQPVPRPVEPLPTIAVIPSSIAVAVPSVVTEEPKVPLTSDTVEVFTHPAEPSSESPPLEVLSLPDVPIVPEIPVVSEVPAEEVAASVALAQPEAPSSSVQLLPSFAPEITTTTTSSNVFPNIASWTTPTPTVTRMNEPDGITKVILGANNQLTTFVTRVETSATHAHTLLSTIVDGHTQVNAVQPTAVMEQSTEGAQVIQESSFSVAKTVSVSQSNEKSTPPPTMEEKSTTMTTTTTTQPPIRLGGIFNFGNNEPAGTSATTTTTTTTEESIADKVLDESINNVLLSGPQRTQVSVNHKPVEVAKCNPQCKDFEICQSRGSAPPTCVCRPGYARSDATQPCTKAFTYQVRLAVENVKQPSRSNFTWMADPSAPEYHQITQVLRTGIQDTLERADLWNAYRNADVMAVKPMEGSAHKHALAEFVVQLGSQYDEQQLKSSLQKALEINQYRLGEDVMVAARVSDGLVVQDFDECSGGTHDCPESSVCVNNHGSYECQCKPGMQDAIDGSGRLCIGASQELGDCELCSRQGRCETSPAGENVCICNYWFTGDKCQFNLKVLMIALVSLGVLLILLIFGCIIVCCIRNRRASSTISPAAPAFLRYRGGVMPPTGTMDRTAMIRGDTSSESSVGLGVSGIDNMAGTLEGRGKGNAGASLQSYRHYGEGDDKVPVIIPRVRTHREQPPVHNEQQMLSFLEQGRTGQGRLRASTDNLASVGARSSSTLTTLRGPESSDGPNHTSTPNLTNANPPDDVDSTMNEARSYDETTVRPAVRHLHSSTGSVNRTQSHGGKQYFQHEDARSPGVRGQGRPSLRLAFPRPSLYTSFRDSEGSNFDSL